MDTQPGPKLLRFPVDCMVQHIEFLGKKKSN